MAHRSIFATHEIKIYAASAVTLIVLAATVLAYFYLSSPHVRTESFGGPEQFGQFGDYIGGILNPMLGSLTVIFLLFANWQQRQSTEHAWRQLQVSKDEYNRKQLEDVLTELHQRQQDLYKMRIPGGSGLYSSPLSVTLEEELYRALANGEPGLKFKRSRSNKDLNLTKLLRDAEDNLRRITRCCYEIMKLTHNDAVRDHWTLKAQQELNDGVRYGVITAEEMESQLKVIFDSYVPTDPRDMM